MPDTADPPPEPSAATAIAMVELVVDGRAVEVPAAGSLLEVLRERLGKRSAKDGCSPQGQCGCCTVLVDGAPRVACVTPVRRVAGRYITTLDGLDPEVLAGWADSFLATGASQCGFCTPGIIVRLEALRAKGADPADHEAVGRALAAHLCRCTGWQTISEAWDEMTGTAGPPASAVAVRSRRNLDAAAQRAAIEGGTVQRVDAAAVLGRGGFADDSAPADALVAVPDDSGGWIVAESPAEARAAAGKRQGRRTTVDAHPPLDLPAGDWAVALRTSWVEPAYLETDAAWCNPRGEPTTPLANGGAFGAKIDSPVADAAKRLAMEHGRTVRVLLSRQDTVMAGPKRPPIAAGLAADGRGVLVAARTRGLAELMTSIAPELQLVEVDVVGPPTSLALRGAIHAELAMLRAGLTHRLDPVVGATGAVAEASIEDGHVSVRVSCGDPLDEIVLRSYCIGAAHMALGFVTSEALAVDDEGVVLDLTVRSFGVLRALETPAIEITIDRDSAGPPVNGSDAVFAAVAAAAWLNQGCPTDLPTKRGPLQ